MATYTEPLRKRLEELGYGVQWQGQGQPIAVTKDGHSWYVPVYEYEIGSDDRAYVSPETITRITNAVLPSGFNQPENKPDLTGLQQGRSYFEQKGYDVGWDPASKRVSVTHPVTGTKQYATPEALWDGRSYFSPTTLSAIEGRLTPGYEKTYKELVAGQDQYLQQLQGNMNQYINAINNYIQQHSDRSVAMLAAYQDKYLESIKTLQQWMQPSTEVPQSVKVALKILEDETVEARKRLDAEMHRRGIYNSGLAAEMQAKLEKGLTTEREKLLAGWVDENYRRAYSTALEVARLQAQFAGGYTDLYSKAYLEPINLLMQQAGNVYKKQSDYAKTAYDLTARLKQWFAEKEMEAVEGRRKRESDAAKQRAEYLNMLLKQDQQRSLDAYRWASLKSQDAYRQAIAELRAAENSLRNYGNPAAENAFIGDLMAQPSAEAAYNYITEYKGDILDSGARISVLLDAVKKRWPASADALERLFDYLGG